MLEWRRKKRNETNQPSKHILEMMELKEVTVDAT
jgi:hypothetical protein